jgi:hypothetical protein
MRCGARSKLHGRSARNRATLPAVTSQPFPRPNHIADQAYDSETRAIARKLRGHGGRVRNLLNRHVLARLPDSSTLFHETLFFFFVAKL